jgi:hypothetical protein
VIDDKSETDFFFKIVMVVCHDDFQAINLTF